MVFGGHVEDTLDAFLHCEEQRREKNEERYEARAPRA
jgi:hypothetical protein